MRILPSSRLRRILVATTLLLPALGTLGLVSPANAAVTTFTNSAPIAIPQFGNGAPYPSTIAVSGLATNVKNVELTLTDIRHEISYDAHVMLVSPTGRNLTVVSDVYWNNQSQARTFTFADGAPALTSGRPGAAPTGRYAPTDLGGPNTFPAPAPAQSGATTFAGAFNGTNPNGTWQLFVYDDIGGGAGNIGSWSLKIDAGIPQVVTFGTTAPNPARVGDTYKPTATSDAGFPVTYSVAASTTNNACRLADDDQTLFFQHSGTCVVAADAAGDVDHDPGRATQTITVVAAQSDLATLAISPLNASTTAGQPVPYSVQGTDSSGNAIPGQQATYSFTPAGGGASTVCPSGACAPVSAGTYTVTASAPGKTGPVTSSTTLTVLADDVAALSITPEDSATTAGTPVQFTVGGIDEFGNALPDQTSASTVVATPVGGGTPVTCASGLCDLTVAGVWSVSASQSGAGAPASDATTLTVAPAALDHVELAGDATTVAGTPVVYTVTAYDRFDNVRQGAATVTATRGATTITCPNGVCAPTTAGTWTVQGTVGGETDSADLEVTAGPLSSLVVSPDVTTVTPGTDVTYTAAGADTYGNSLGDRTATSAFSLQRADGSGSSVPCPDAVCTPGAPGSFRVTATDGSVSGTATLVSALPSVSLELGALPTSTYGDGIPLSATATSPDGAPSGSVQFNLDGSPVGSPVAVNGSGVATAPALTGVHAGTHMVSATFTATPAGAYDTATTTQRFVVAQAPTTTKLAVTSSLTATVASAAGTPGGAVTFAIDGADVATVPLTGGTATWQGDNTGGPDSVVTATYSGAADFLSSAVSTARQDPKVQATLSGTARNGWHNQPVTVTFTCAPGSAPVTCPAPAVIDKEGAGQTVTRTVVAADGGIAVVTSAPVSLDLTAPDARTVGVEAGRVYNGTAPDAACAATDALSGLADCTVVTSGNRPGTLRTTVTATDLAGNTTTAATTYSVRDLWITRSEQVGGAWNVPIGGGRMLQLVDSGFPVVKAKGDLAAKDFRFAGRLDGVGHWTSRVRVPAGVRPGKILKLTIKRDDGSVQRVRIRAVRR
ncbi:Ig-like domain-containing protein [Nocardioides currus]|uniref:P/Homo B domain-containing protein n=1 Tax=Nocardioides currus TaxID=2133958 RepID=A0A2R7Z062_9ACTN|nr:Ig-like domain-containing protein [Nocardioides currus]PUA81549.1 hypothetical protein C7S10_05575 [Nocardioides currus]